MRHEREQSIDEPIVTRGEKVYQFGVILHDLIVVVVLVVDVVVVIECVHAQYK